MTHSLHRQGTRESLRKDFVLISFVTKKAGRFWPDSAERMEKLGRICIKHVPNNYGHHQYIFQGSYSDFAEIKELLKDLIQADLGLSVTLTGPMDEIVALGRQLNLKLNSAHLSLGVFGNKKLLPDERVLEVTSMCGHHCISSVLVENLINDLKLESITMEAAVNQLSDLCTCKILNPERAREILERIIEER